MGNILTVSFLKHGVNECAKKSQMIREVPSVKALFLGR